MPEPHLPVIGMDYWHAKYKIAFFGIETNQWGDMTSFVKEALANPENVSRRNQSSLDNLECLNWTNNFHSSFWDFIILFLASFYKVNVSDIRSGKYPELIRSIIWGNTNAIERYSLQAQNNGVDVEVYDKIKKQSKIFDHASHLIDIVRPKVVLILNWGEDESWVINNKTDYHYYTLNKHMVYYYNRVTNTHIFQLHHPRSIFSRDGFPSIISELLEKMNSFHIWKTLPNSEKDVLCEEEDSNMFSRRNKLIADIAEALIKSHSVMCGQQLVEILNRNGIRKDNGDQYYEGRGIYKVISNAWHYYHDSLKDEQTAYNIAMSFVTKNNEYAY